MSPADRLFAEMASVAERCAGCEALYLVGGAVRDHLLGSSPESLRDLDFVVVGDAVDFTAELVRHCGGEMSSHERFFTATWTSPLWARPVDIVTARREAYLRPGELPVVEKGTLEDDLRRRDFTINSMAAALWPGERWQLADPLGCLADLQDAVLKIHHPGSFSDDPTRILRLARFAVRLSLRPHEDTRAALEAALAERALGTVSGDRLWAEWELLCREPQPAAAVVWMDANGLCDALAISAAGAGAAVMERGLLARAEGRPWDALQALASLLLGAETGDCADRFGLEGAQAGRLATLAALPQRLSGALERCAADDELEALLGTTDVTQRAFLVAASPATFAAVERYEGQVLSLPPLLRGEDLLAAGLAQGPALGEALHRVRAAQLRGEVGSPAEALQLLGLG